MHAQKIFHPEKAPEDIDIMQEGSAVALQDKGGAACHKYIGCRPGKCGTNRCTETIVRVWNIFAEFSKTWKREI